MLHIISPFESVSQQSGWTELNKKATYTSLLILLFLIKTEQFNAENLASECHCPIPCDIVIYDGKISTAYLPGQHISTELRRRENKTEEHIRYTNFYYFQNTDEVFIY